jgi:hypothetical protein
VKNGGLPHRLSSPLAHVRKRVHKDKRKKRDCFGRKHFLAMTKTLNSRIATKGLRNNEKDKKIAG